MTAYQFSGHSQWHATETPDYPHLHNRLVRALQQCL
jgi:hypothetical protein